MSVAGETLDIRAHGGGEQPGARWTTIVGRLLGCSRQMRRALAEQVRHWGINDTEFLLLFWCGQSLGGGAPQNGLSHSIGVSPGQASGMLERLRQRGWVTVERSRRDRRKQFIVLTSPGRRLLDEMLSALQPWGSQLDAQLSVAEQRSALELLQRLGRFLCFVIALLALGPGCHRAYYRRQADAEAEALVREKANHPHWPLERNWIDVDPRSRMFDPFDPDRPPLPPDDPASHELMHYVDEKPGYPYWHANGETSEVQNPNWMAYLALDERGVLKVASKQAYELALLHSRNYQQQFETLYLSALDVSAERFRFDTQFFGGYSAFYTAAGRARTPRSELNLSSFTQETGRLGLPSGGVRAPSSGNILMRKGFGTGADLAVGLANSLVWDFAGTDTHSATTILDFGLVQPLLRAAGRDRILEQLTIAERTLLANVRQMERFRRAFYVEIMTGRDAGQGASRRGGFFGASGLEGFTGVGGGGFGRIGGGGGAAAGAGGFGGGGAGAAEAGGFFGLLQNQQDIRNQQVTIAGLRSNLTQLRESLRENLARIPDDPETIVRERLQIAQARQALLNAESRLLISQASYQATLDRFKMTLGLPPELCVHVDDPMLDPFNLIDPDVLAVQNQVTQLRDKVGDTNEQILQEVQYVQVNDQRKPTLPWNDELEAKLRRLKSSLDRTREISDRVASANLSRAREDIEKLKEVLPRRRQDLLRMREKYRQDLDRFRRYGDLDPCQETLLADIDPAVFDVNRLDVVPGELDGEATRLETQFDSYNRPLEEIESYLDDLLSSEDKPEPAELYAQLEEKVIFAIPSLLSNLSDDLLDLSLVKARARADMVELKPVDLKWDMAVEIARRYRRDWMNARAALVDAWRLIEFNADNLESTLDVVFDGDLRNTGDNPLRLRDINGQLRVGLRFDAPITRLQERNTYRQALIEYQQAKRNYYAAVDAITLALRNTLRTIDLNRLNFEERRIAVLSAIEQVILTDQIQKLREERGLESGVTAARDVVSALADLQNAQNDFLNVWVNYEVQRLNLDLDLGTMNLDAEGYWIDPGPVGPEFGYPTPMGFEEHLPEWIFGPVQEPRLLPSPADHGEGEVVPLGKPDSPDG